MSCILVIYVSFFAVVYEIKSSIKSVKCNCTAYIGLSIELRSQ